MKIIESLVLQTREFDNVKREKGVLFSHNFNEEYLDLFPLTKNELDFGWGWEASLEAL
jgi:hypothetical protein